MKFKNGETIDSQNDELEADVVVPQQNESLKMADEGELDCSKIHLVHNQPLPFRDFIEADSMEYSDNEIPEVIEPCVCLFNLLLTGYYGSFAFGIMKHAGLLAFIVDIFRKS